MNTLLIIIEGRIHIPYIFIKFSGISAPHGSVSLAQHQSFYIIFKRPRIITFAHHDITGTYICLNLYFGAKIFRISSTYRKIKRHGKAVVARLVSAVSHCKKPFRIQRGCLLIKTASIRRCVDRQRNRCR